MFKAPKYRAFMDPKSIPDGYRQSLGTKEVSDRDFRTAMGEAYWLFSLAIDQATAARMRRQRRVGVAGKTSKAEQKATALLERRRGEIIWLLAGLQGMHLPFENAAAREKAKELCLEAQKRAKVDRIQVPFHVNRLGSAKFHMQPNQKKTPRGKVRIGKTNANYPKGTK